MRRPIRRAARRPFGRLVSHFLARLVRGGKDGASEGFDLTLGPLLGLLATPGAISCFILLMKYSSLLNWIRRRHNVDIFATSLPEKYMYIVIAMAVCGIITVLKWDKLLPDSQDYLNLAPLPVRARTIFFANAIAILIAVAVIAIDVSAIPSVLFPIFVAASGHLPGAQPLQFVAVHWLCVGLASVFSIFAVFAILGTMSVVLPRAAFRACSGVARGILLLAFFVLLLTAFGGQELVARLQRYPGSWIEWLPSLWYVGLYQSLQHRATPALARAALWAWTGTAAAVALTAIAYAVSYQRRFAGVLETGRKAAGRFQIVLAVLDLFARRTAGFDRGCHRFVVRALLRSETHRMTIAVSVGMGWLLTLAARDPVRQGPLVAAYLLLLGLRVAFDLPAAASANWIFRTILDEKENQVAGVARRVMLSFLTPLVLAPAFVWGWWEWGIGAAALHTFYVLGLSWTLLELLLLNYRKLPLTCPMPGFRDNFLMICVIQITGLVFFSVMGARLERWMLLSPERLLLLPAAMAVAWFWNRRRIHEARSEGELEEGLVFDNPLPVTVERMNLSDGV